MSEEVTKFYGCVVTGPDEAAAKELFDAGYWCQQRTTHPANGGVEWALISGTGVEVHRLILTRELVEDVGFAFQGGAELCLREFHKMWEALHSPTDITTEQIDAYEAGRSTGYWEGVEYMREVAAQSSNTGSKS